MLLPKVVLRKTELNPEAPSLLIEQGPGGRVETNTSDLCERERTRRRCQGPGDLQSVIPILMGYSAWVVGKTKKGLLYAERLPFLCDITDNIVPKTNCY